ncbi:hypothetical protein HUG10_21320 (plasmid) [Halorarum halophilum]|uniref:Uncharacterized protein n=1 Tax=Halorarum halophilum TaxID=2743090 RepID=A0A7D5GIS2_9EURY|nr:hypothetical protein [Halobaculum halophilum]QLG30130.1 hypothetical protein HUG10_21320 [Halobaculum halophilum]
MSKTIIGFDQFEVPDDDRWHHMEVTMSGTTIEGIVFDGDIMYATQEYMEGRDDLDGIDDGRAPQLG